MTDSFGGTESSVYDADNLLASRQYSGEGQDLLIDFSYDYLGEVTQQVDMYGGSTVVSTNDTGYDANGNVTSMHDVTSGGTTVNFDYAYDVASELTQEIDNGATTIAYAYDATGQLTSAGTAGYNYDANGNPDNAGETTGADNELLTDGTYNYTYDHAGNETSKTDIATSDYWTYSYNNANELIAAVDKNASNQIETSVAYAYDAFGNKIEATTVTYGTAGYEPSATTSAALKDIINYDAFGNVIWETCPIYGGEYKYTGEEFDKATGLQYNDHRWYNPETGRWMTQDPDGFSAGDSNLYRYVNNSPMDGVDPSGELFAPLGAMTAQEKKNPEDERYALTRIAKVNGTELDFEKVINHKQGTPLTIFAASLALEDKAIFKDAVGFALPGEITTRFNSEIVKEFTRNMKVPNINAKGKITVDNSTSPPTATIQAEFNNLPPGDYKIRILCVVEVGKQQGKVGQGNSVNYVYLRVTK